MVGKKWLKLIKSLHQKKYRNEHQLFFVEGKKVLREVLNAELKPVKVIVSEEMKDEFSDVAFEIATDREFNSISALKNPNGVLGVFEISASKSIQEDDWVVALDDIRDPGNLGTIIRLCDWYGIKTIICSLKTVDLYNPKVIQATMGSLVRVNVCYQPLEEYFANTTLPIYGAFMDGVNVYQEQLPKQGILLMGNEANGISDALQKLVSKKIAIPQFGATTAESLNVSIATGILLNEIRRD